MVNARLIIVFALVTTGSLLSAASSRAEPALLLVEGADAAGLRALKVRLEKAGARLPHLLPPDVLLGDVPADLLASVSIPPELRVRVVQQEDALALRTEAGLSRSARSALRVLAGLTRAPAGLPPGGSPQDVVPPTPEEAAASGPAKALRDPDCDRPAPLSAYLAGHVAVAVFLPESTGAEDSEDWNTEDPRFPGEDRRDLVLAEIIEGLGELESSLPSAGLSFVYDFRADLEIESEPIAHSVGDRSGWMGETLDAIGYGARGEATGVSGYLNDLRDVHDADWAVAAFVADDLNDADNGFPPTGFPFAYALLGGPYMVMTYDNDGWGLSRMNLVFRHELGHCFHALDEYRSAGNDCRRSSGYLRVENANNDSPPVDADCLSSVPCAMRANDTVDFCEFTRGQLGIRDSDGDGILDVRDAPPNTTLDESGLLLIETDALVIGATATGHALPGESPDSPTSWFINRVSAAEYRLDGGGWTALAPLDGSYGGRCERFEIALAGLAEGFHELEIRATNDVGLVEPSPASLTIYVNTDCADDALEPDDDAGQARPHLGGLRAGLFHCAFDEDWSVFHLQEGASLRASVDFDPAFADLELTLRDPAGNEMARGARAGGTISLMADATRSGSHYLVVSGLGEGEGAYDLDVDADCLDDPSEPDDDPAQGRARRDGIFSSLVLCPASLDHSRIAVQAGETLTASIAFDGALGDLDLELLDPAGASVALSAGAGDSETVEATPTEEGVYTVRVLGKTPADRAVYELSLAATGCIDDVSEPDDEAVAAKPLEHGDDRRGWICGSDEDWFSFELTRSRLVRLRLTHDPAAGALELELRDEAGGTLLGRAGGPAGDLDLTRGRLGAGRYSLRLRSPAASELAYRLRLEVEDPVLLFVRRDPVRLTAGGDVLLSWNDAGQECYTVSRSDTPSDFSLAQQWLVQESEQADTDQAIEDLEHRDPGVVLDGRFLYSYLVDPSDCGGSLVASIKTAEPYPVAIAPPGSGLPQIIFTVSAVNEGTEDVFGVTITDDLAWNVTDFEVLEIPAGATDASEPAPAGDNFRGRIVVTGVSVPAGGSAQVRFRITPTRDASDGPVIIDNQAYLQAVNLPPGPGDVYRTDDPATRVFGDDTRVFVVTATQTLRVSAFWHREVNVDVRLIDPCGNVISEQDALTAICDGSTGDLRWSNCVREGFPTRSEWLEYRDWPLPSGLHQVEVAYPEDAWSNPDCAGAGEEDITVVAVTGTGEVYWRTVVLSPGSDFVPVFEFTTP